MLPYRDGRITKILLGIFFILVIFYAYYEARGLLFGPSIDVPQGAALVNERLITIRGKAERIAQLTMNGMPVTVTENGDFEEPYLLNNGYNRMVLRARDKYGRTSEKVLEIIYGPLVVEVLPTASSTPSY